MKIVIAVAIGANGKYGASESHPDAFDSLKLYVQEGASELAVDVYKLTVELPRPGGDPHLPIESVKVGGPGDLPLQPFKEVAVA